MYAEAWLQCGRIRFQCFVSLKQAQTVITSRHSFCWLASLRWILDEFLQWKKNKTHTAKQIMSASCNATTSESVQRCVSRARVYTVQCSWIYNTFCMRWWCIGQIAHCKRTQHTPAYSLLRKRERERRKKTHKKTEHWNENGSWIGFLLLLSLDYACCGFWCRARKIWYIFHRWTFLFPVRWRS